MARPLSVGVRAWPLRNKDLILKLEIKNLPKNVATKLKGGGGRGSKKLVAGYYFLFASSLITMTNLS